MDNPSFPGYFHVISRFFIWVGGLRRGCLLFVIVDLLYNDHIQSSIFSVTFQGATFIDDRRYPEIGGYVQCFLSYLAQEKHPKLAGKACRALFGQSRMKYTWWYLQQLANVVKHGGSTVAKMIQNIIMIMWNSKQCTRYWTQTHFSAVELPPSMAIRSSGPTKGVPLRVPMVEPGTLQHSRGSFLRTCALDGFLDVRGTTHTDHKKVKYTMY